MIAEGRALRELHEHVTVKVPFCEEGLAATHALTAEGIPVNMTLVFSANQALLAAGAGATYVSCFMGRLDDISVDSGQVVAEIVECFRAGGVTSQIIAASIRHPEHVIAAAQLGCEIATVPAKVLRQMLEHPLTDRRRRALPQGLGVAPRVRRLAARPGLQARRRDARLTSSRTERPPVGGAGISWRPRWRRSSTSCTWPTFTSSPRSSGCRASGCFAAPSSSARSKPGALPAS